MSIKEKRTAFHEAGHVAADLLLEHCPDHATIFEKDGALGSAHQADGDRNSVEGLEKLVISLYAGAEAEKRIIDDHESVMLGTDSDYEKAEKYLRLLDSTKEPLEQRTAELLQEHWPLVELLANSHFNNCRFAICVLCR